MDIDISSRARSYVRRRATMLMEATCRIERVNKPSFDQATGKATSGSRTTIYEGKCRVFEVTGGAPIMIGEDDVTMQTTQLSIPWDASPVPQRHDEVVITDHKTDAEIIGNRYVIDSYAKAGELRPTRRFILRGYQERQR